jgi:RHS repeat-associated protein
MCVNYLNTPRRVTDETNNIVWKWESTPFGETKPTGTLEFNLRFSGQYFDNETSIHYNINRDYNPVTGRYIQSDPIGLDGGFSTFAYVNGNPIMLVDLEGLFGLGGSNPKIGLLTECDETSAFATTKESNDLYTAKRFNMLSNIQKLNYYNKLRAFHTPCIPQMSSLVLKEMIHGELSVPDPISWIIKSVYIGKTIGDPKIEVLYFRDKIEVWRMK